jgi:hypothetical protein
MQCKTIEKCFNSIEPVDLLAERLKLEKLVPSEVQEYFFLNKNDLYFKLTIIQKVFKS